MYEPILKTKAAKSLLVTLLASVASSTAAPLFAADDIEELEVIGGRLPLSYIGQAVNVVDPQAQPVLRIDSALGQIPGVSLFRRANSLTANPTTQGLTIRGVGANAAGRALVTLDGVPLNDPFGGWVYFSALDPRQIAEARVLKGGSAGAFGAQALAGTISLISRTPDETGGYALFEYGDDETVRYGGGLDFVDDDENYISLSGGRFETNGPFLFSEEQRGPIDVRAASDATFGNILGGYAVSEETEVFFSLRGFEEDRINGLSLAPNSTDGFDGSFRIVHDPAAGASYELLAYYRTRDFANAFSSARDERTTERQVLNQFDVPGSGGGFLARVQLDTIEFGLDARRFSGETNELFRNLGNGFTRQRSAGGDQWIVGAYADYIYEADWGELSVSGRIDRYRTYNGSRIESDLADGAVLRNDPIDNQSDWQVTGRAGLRYEISPALSLKSAAYRSFRLPTINEFFRPFRVVNDITEANPELVPEKLYGAEIGFSYDPIDTIHAAITYYRNWLEDGVGNITIGFGPGFFPLGGFVPDGGVLRQRANIDRSITDGIEAEAAVQLFGNWNFVGRYLYANARITAFDANPDLVGLTPVQTPRHTLVLAGTHTFSVGTFHIEGRYSSGQFDDDLNERRLDDIFTVNLGLNYRLNDTFTLSGNIENLFDAEVISALTTGGLETRAQRRFWRVGVSAEF